MGVLTPCALGAEGHRQCQQIGCWRLVVGDMLAPLADTLLLRGCDAILADDFAAVREMLETGGKFPNLPLLSSAR